jgi:hypothetical protein
MSCINTKVKAHVMKLPKNDFHDLPYTWLKCQLFWVENVV